MIFLQQNFNITQQNSTTAESGKVIATNWTNRRLVPPSRSVRLLTEFPDATILIVFMVRRIIHFCTAVYVGLDDPPTKADKRYVHYCTFLANKMLLPLSLLNLFWHLQLRYSNPLPPPPPPRWVIRCENHERFRVIQPSVTVTSKLLVNQH